MRLPSGEIPARSESGRIPATIGPYRVQREIGRGAAGVVYSVTRDGSEGTYALKLIRDLEGIDEDGLVRFQREAQLSSRLNHPGVVGALDAGAVGRHRYLVLPYVEGESLGQRLRRERSLPPEDAATLIGRVADALAAVHAAGVIHRDIKPDNILLDQHLGGAPRLTDFGIAREGHGRGSLTQSSAFLGTPAYMAPEQIQAASLVDGRADVYSLASVLYECLAGLPPFQGATTFQVADQVLHGEPAHLREVAPEVPRALAEACHAALAKDPGARPDAATFARLLHAAVQEEPPRRGRGPQLLLGVAVLAGLIAITTSIAFQLTSPDDVSPPPQSARAEPRESAAPAPTTRSLTLLRAETLKASPLDPLVVEELRTLIKDPERAGPAALVLGDYLIRRGDLPAAEEALSRVPEEVAEWRRAALLRSQIMFRLGRAREGDALEADLLLGDLEDSVGRLVRARRLIAWDRDAAALELLQPLLRGAPPDRVAVDLALRTHRLSLPAAKELLLSAGESDPIILAHLGNIQSVKDKEAAQATLARAEALCAPRECAPALLVRVIPFLGRNEAGVVPPQAKPLLQLLQELEPSGDHLLLFLAYAGPPEAVRQDRSELLRRESPAQFARLLRTQRRRTRLLQEFAVPFYPEDESWTWARQRVSKLPARARRHGFRALTAAIGGLRSWPSIADELRLAVRADDSGGARDLAAEVCIRRGRLAEALEFAKSKGPNLSPRWRGLLALYRGHEVAGLRALREGEDNLNLAMAALATGEPEEAGTHLGRLEPSVDVRLARFEAAFALEQKQDAIANAAFHQLEVYARAAKGADEVARAPIRASLARVQAQIGSLDFRLGAAYGLLELKNSFRPQGPRDEGHPADPVQRAVYYAGDGNVPCAYFLRRALFYSIHQKPDRRAWTATQWGQLFLPLMESLLGAAPAPVLDIHLALLDEPGKAIARVTRARQRDPQVQVAEHLLSIVDARFPERRSLFASEE